MGTQANIFRCSFYYIHVCLGGKTAKEIGRNQDVHKLESRKNTSVLDPEHRPGSR